VSRVVDVGWDVILLAAVVVVLAVALAQGWAAWAVALLAVSVALLAARAGLDLLRRRR